MLKNKYIIISYLFTFILALILINFSHILNKKYQQLFFFKKYYETHINNEFFIDTNSVIIDSVLIFNYITHEVKKNCPDLILYKMFFSNKNSKTKKIISFLNTVIYIFKDFPYYYKEIKQNENTLFFTIIICSSKKITISISLNLKDNRIQINYINGHDELIRYLDSILK